MSLSSLCNQTADIQRPTYAADAYGGQTATWATTYDDIRISLQPARGKVIEEFARLSMQITHVAYTGSTVSLKAGDRLVCNSKNYLVQAYRDMAGQARAYAIYLLEKD